MSTLDGWQERWPARHRHTDEAACHVLQSVRIRSRGCAKWLSAAPERISAARHTADGWWTTSVYVVTYILCPTDVKTEYDRAERRWAPALPSMLKVRCAVDAATACRGRRCRSVPSGRANLKHRQPLDRRLEYSSTDRTLRTATLLSDDLSGNQSTTYKEEISRRRHVRHQLPRNYIYISGDSGSEMYSGSDLRRLNYAQLRTTTKCQFLPTVIHEGSQHWIIRNRKCRVSIKQDNKYMYKIDDRNQP